MSESDQLKYRRLIKSLIDSLDVEAAMRLAPGGEFEAIGILERQLLIQYGLKRDGYLIDVGCGSGRLALPVSQYLSGRYLGIDIIPELVDYARRLVPRPDWRFAVTTGSTIPEKDGEADMVCFFSVFTHVQHELAYIYLQEAKRVLKRGGRIVFSFMEFACASHWQFFENAIRKLDDDAYPATIFVCREAIQAWASHLNLKVEAIAGGDEPRLALAERVIFEDGSILEGNACFGQSFCVLSSE